MVSVDRRSSGLVAGSARPWSRGQREPFWSSLLLSNPGQYPYLGSRYVGDAFTIRHDDRPNSFSFKSGVQRFQGLGCPLRAVIRRHGDVKLMNLGFSFEDNLESSEQVYCSNFRLKKYLSACINKFFACYIVQCVWQRIVSQAIKSNEMVILGIAANHAGECRLKSSRTLRHGGHFLKPMSYAEV